MSNEFQHKSVGSQMTQTEYEHTDGTGHIFDSQAIGDIPYADSSTVLKRLGIGSTGQVLEVSSGKPAWTNTIYHSGLILGYGASDATINFATDNNIIFKIDNTAQIKLVDGVLQPQTDSDVDLGTTSVRFKDAYIDSATVTGDVSVGDDLTLGSDSSVINMGAGNDATFTHDGTTGVTIAANPITLDSGADIVLDADGANIIFKDDGTSILDIGNSSTDVELTVSTADKNFAIKGTDGSSAITALDIDMALAGKATFNGDVVVGGDLTVSGDDLFMGTNTAGMLLVADGTNFNPTAVTSLSAISSIDNADTFLAIDDTDGALKKVARSVVVSGLATSGALSNVVEDTAPHLGGDLDVQTNSIITDASNRNIKLAPHGTGLIEVRGNTNPGSIILNCESNSHGQTIKAQAHSEGVTNTLTLPAGSSSTLVSLVSTDTLTNKTLTTPKIAEIDSLSSGNITLDAEANIELNADGGTITFKDDSASLGTITSSGYSGNAATATDATNSSHVLVTDNESTDENNLITFVEGATSSTGNVGLEMDGNLTYNPSSGTLTATNLAGTLTTAAQTNITSVGALGTGSITSGFTSIDVGSGTIDTTGAVSTGNLSPAGDVAIADAKLIKLGGSRMATAEPATSGTGYGTVVGFDSAGSVTVGDAVCVNTSGQVTRANANNGSTTDPAIGIATNTASNSGDDCYVLINGVWRNDNENIDEGKPVYLGESAGAITKTRPSGSGDLIQILGIGVGDGSFLVMPSLDVIEHA